MLCHCCSWLSRLDMSLYVDNFHQRGLYHMHELLAFSLEVCPLYYMHELLEFSLEVCPLYCI